MGKPKQPKQPDPYKVADAQTKSNLETAAAQAKLAMSNTSGPLGSVSYTADPNSPSGYSQTTALDPATQALLSQTQATKQAGLTGATDLAGQPFDLSGATGSNIANIQRSLLDPQWQQQSDALDAKLRNEGIMPGSEAYANRMQQFSQQRQDAYNQMYLQAFGQAQNQAINQRNIPFGQYLSLAGLSNPQTQTAPNTPSPGVAPTDLTGPVYQSYGIAQNAYNQAMGGLYGLGGTLLGSSTGQNLMGDALMALGL